MLATAMDTTWDTAHIYIACLAPLCIKSETPSLLFFPALGHGQKSMGVVHYCLPGHPTGESGLTAPVKMPQGAC